MAYKLHHHPFADSRSSQPGNEGYAAAVVAQVRQDAHDVVPVTAPKQIRPKTASGLRVVVREGQGTLSPRSLQCGQDGFEFRVNGHRAPLVALGVNQDLPLGEVDAVHGETGFGNAPALADGEDEGVGHPAVRNGQVPLLCRQGVTDQRFLFGANLGLLLGAGLNQHHVGKRVADDERAPHRFTHYAPKQFQLYNGGLHLGAVHVATVLLPPCEILHGERVSYTLGLQDCLGSEESSRETPVHQVQVESELLALIGEAATNPVVNPAIPHGGQAATGRDGATGLLASHVKSLLPAQRIVLPFLAALELTASTRANPNPPERTTGTLVDAERSTRGSHNGQCNAVSLSFQSKTTATSERTTVFNAVYCAAEYSCGVYRRCECHGVTVSPAKHFMSLETTNLLAEADAIIARLIRRN